VDTCPQQQRITMATNPFTDPFLACTLAAMDNPPPMFRTGAAQVTPTAQTPPAPSIPRRLPTQPQWLQPHSRHCPQVGTRHEHPREFPCLEVSHPPYRKRQPNCRSATRPDMPVRTRGNETPTSQSVNNRQDPRAPRHQQPGRGNAETNPHLDQHHQ